VETMMLKAWFVRELMGYAGKAVLFRCEPGGPLPDHVVVSAVVVWGCPETYIFAADPNGEVTGWGELPGSFRGSLDHETALRNAGYEIVRGEDPR